MTLQTQSTVPSSALEAIGNLEGRRHLGDGQLRIKRLPMIAGASGEVDTGWNLPDNAMLMDVFVNVLAAEVTGTTKTVDVGLLSSESGGDADAFVDGISVETTGMKVPAFAATTGSNNTYLGAASTHTIGAKLTSLLAAGADVANAGDGLGIKGPYLASANTAKSITYTRGDTFTEFSGELILVYFLFDNDEEA